MVKRPVAKNRTAERRSCSELLCGEARDPEVSAQMEKLKKPHKGLGKVAVAGKCLVSKHEDQS